MVGLVYMIIINRKVESQELPKNKDGHRPKQKIVHVDNLSTIAKLNHLEMIRDAPSKRYHIRLSGKAKERYLSILINVCQARDNILSHNDFINHILDSIEEPNIRIYNEIKQLKNMIKMNVDKDTYFAIGQLLTLVGSCLHKTKDPTDISKKLEETFFE